jgi:O-acetyl-ADP-ribose deacetylase (regulator of RNase III)
VPYRRTFDWFARWFEPGNRIARLGRGTYRRRERVSELREPGRSLARCGAIDVRVWQGDITRLAVDAIVNAANNEGWLGAGVAGAIRRAAGDEVEGEAVAQAPWPVGDAVRTGPGRLAGQGVKAILHAAAMAPGRPASVEAVGSATAAALRLAAAEGLGSVALPALGTGVGGVDLAAAATAMAAAVREHAAGPTSVHTVVFALYDQAAATRFGGALERELGATR